MHRPPRSTPRLHRRNGEFSCYRVNPRSGSSRISSSCCCYCYSSNSSRSRSSSSSRHRPPRPTPRLHRRNGEFSCYRVNPRSGSSRISSSCCCYCYSSNSSRSRSSSSRHRPPRPIPRLHRRNGEFSCYRVNPRSGSSRISSSCCCYCYSSNSKS